MVSQALEQRITRLLASDPLEMQDPFPLLAELREASPAHRMGHYVLVSRYDDVRAVLAAPKRFGNKTMEEGTARVEDARASITEEQISLYDEFVAMERGMTFMADGEEHDRRRRATGHLFTPARIKTLEELTQRYTDELLDQLAGEERVDLAPATGNLPGWIITELLGLPREDSSMLVHWGDAINLNLHRWEALEPAHAALQEVYAYVGTMVSEHRSGRRSTELFGALLDAEDAGQRRLGSMFVEMQIGGYETTRGLLGGGIVALMRHRDQWERLVAEPELAVKATEELLRFVTPALWTARVPTVETEIAGEVVSSDDTILLMLGAANRDPEMFERPDEVDIERANARRHLALSFGPHVCLGQALARLEGAIFFRTIATRFPDLRLASDEIRRVGNANNPQIESLEVHPGSDRSAGALDGLTRPDSRLRSGSRRTRGCPRPGAPALRPPRNGRHAA